MPVTRSMKSISVTRTPTNTATSTAATSETNTSSTPDASLVTPATTVTRTDTTTTTATDTTSPPESSQPPKKMPSRPASMRSAASTARRRELALAKEELLRKQVELAAARVARLEEEESEEELSEDETLREAMTTEWLESSKRALTMEPHNEDVTNTLGGNTHLQHCEEQPREPLQSSIDPPHGFHTAKEAAAACNITEPPRETYTMPAPVPESQHYAKVSAPPRSHALEAELVPQGQHFFNELGTRSEFDYRQLAEAITLAARAVAPVNTLRNQELPPFNGAANEWLPFKSAYEESVGALSEQENLARLRRSLRGAARDAAQCLFIGATTATEVMKLLAARFGRPDALVMAEMNKLRNLPRLSESPKDICIFASKVLNVTATVKALNKLHYLYNSEVVRGVVEKMPSALRYRYYDFTAEEPEDQPDLITLTKFLERTAERCGSFAPAEVVTTEDRREPTVKKAARSYHTQEVKSTSSTQATACPVCKKEGHSIVNCSTIKSADAQTRWELAKSHKLCFRCMKTRKFRHFCKTKRCGIDGCAYTHHPLLHGSKPPQAENTQPEQNHAEPHSADVVASAKVKIETAALLKIIPIQVVDPLGCYDTYALMDDGSTCTLIEESVATKIGATGPPAPFHVEAVAGTKIDANQSRRVQFNIRGRNTDSHHISARTIASLQLSPQTVPQNVVQTCPHLADLEDQLTYENGTPTVLLGQDNWHLLLPHEVRRGNRNQPVASLTNLGWVLHGIREVRRQEKTQRVSHVIIKDEEEISMEQMMRQHFALESLGVETKRSYNEDEKRALHILEAKTRELPAGGYETGLLWRSDNLSPPDNYDAAMRRLELVERKLDRNESMRARYKAQMQTLLDNDYAELAPETHSDKVWYLPHFAVIHPEKPDKLRIVHDAAARTKGTSLNDMLLSGPDLLQSLPGVLMRFRQRPVAVTADIKDMFLRVTIMETDRDMQRFLWRGDRRVGRPDEYRMKSVIFGATSSPCTAIFVKNKNAEKYRDSYPAAVDAIVNNHYVDNYISSFNTEEEAIEVSTQVTYIHSQGNFHLQRWASNSKLVHSKFTSGQREDIVQLGPEKVLGMVWNKENDTLTFNIGHNKILSTKLDGEKTTTKREALRTVMSIYDPLGLATPITIQAKRILQETWRSGIDWDAELRPTEAGAWNKWLTEVKQLARLAVPRCHLSLTSADDIQLHTFVDASSSAYAAAVYWRIVDKEGHVYISLIMSKAKVAPLKTVSIPRLELQAAVLGQRLAQTVLYEHEVIPSRRFYWSDSRTVLSWIRKGPRVFKPFVAHRVAEITDNSKVNEWRWVPTKMNVADDATRDTPNDFTSEHRWFRGADFLYLPEEQWPQEEEESMVPTEDEERVHTTRTSQRLTEALPDITRFSNWNRVIHTTARVLMFIDRLRPKQRNTVTYKRTKKIEDTDPTWKQTKKRSQALTPAIVKRSDRVETAPIDADYLNRALELWVRAQQQDVFAQEIDALKKQQRVARDSRLSQLSLTVDNHGVIRLKSRIGATADITATQKEPAIIDGSHPWTRLYISWIHKQLHHGGFETTANEVRQQYWVLRLRYAVRSELSRCQACRIRKAKPAQPSTGDHPYSRLAHHQRPFTYTGLDYFGPLTISVGRSHQKRYGVLFTCLTTRAIHLELAGSLTTDSAIMALRRFIGRRGCPTELWSDQGSNLRGADEELKRAAKEAMKAESAVRFVKWRYIPPSAPFMGGAWERMVRRVKNALNITLHERAPKEEILQTLLIEAEHTVNSRPLTHVSTAAEDEDALTPNHFLLGGPSRVPQPGTFTEGDAAGRREWRVSQRLADTFWARWVREYLPELQHRREPYSRGTIQLNDLVLIADGTLPRNSWPRGRVVATFPGADGIIRAVDVQTSKGTLRRPTKKLAILPVDPSKKPANTDE